MTTNEHIQHTFEVDDRGLVRACPNCGQRNRLLYKGLGKPFRCKKCQTELLPPAEPVEVPGSAEFEMLIARSALPVLTDFWAPWCGPCKMISPEVKKVAAETAGRWLVVKVNTEELHGVAQQYRISAIPMLAVFRDGIEIARQPGVMPAPAILDFMRRAIQP